MQCCIIALHNEHKPLFMDSPMKFLYKITIPTPWYSSLHKNFSILDKLSSLPGVLFSLLDGHHKVLLVMV